jgi:hypothetical protein
MACESNAVRSVRAYAVCVGDGRKKVLESKMWEIGKALAVGGVCFSALDLQKRSDS